MDLGDLDRGVDDRAVAGERDRADDLVRAAGQARDVLARLGGVARLAEDVAVDGDQRVGAERQPAGVGTASALRRAFSSATATGSPCVSSSTSGRRT